MDESEAISEARQMLARLTRRTQALKEAGMKVGDIEAKLRLAASYIEGANTRKVMHLLNEADVLLQTRK